ncbi:Alpha/beta hydrolase fold-1 [Mycena galericulata]|nr:Alpha/beta hydrolase fold-1 [Mycena galericulata]
MTANRYKSQYSADIGGLTLIFVHGIGGHKEQWEPIIQGLFRLQHSKLPHQRVHEVWALDRQNHGDAALINRDELLRSREDGVSAYEWADAIAAFARSPRLRGKRLVPIAHSAGAISVVGSTRAMNISAIPYAALVLIEPSMVTPDVFHRHIEKTISGLSATIKTRRDKWPSREAAHQWLRARYPWNIWDSRVFQSFIVLQPLLEILASDRFLIEDYGLVPTPTGELTLKCDKHQEANCYPDPVSHFDSVKQISRIWRAVPLHIVWGNRDDLVPEVARGSISDRSEGRGAASIIRMQGGHMLPQENPDGLAFAIGRVLDPIPALSEIPVQSRL